MAVLHQDLIDFVVHECRLLDHDPMVVLLS